MKRVLYTVYAYIFGNRIFLYFNKLLFQLSLRGMGILNHYNHTISGEKNFLNKILPKYNPNLIFDVGANVGNYTLAVLNKNKCNIYAFEPNPPTADRLSNNLAPFKQVQVIELGMSDIVGEADIFDRDEQESTSQASLYREVFVSTERKEIKSTKIKLTTIDTFCNEKNIDKISLLKIDTEGNEYRILQGSRQLISEKRIDIIHFEFNSMNIASRVYFKDFKMLLQEYNFYRLLPFSLLKIDYNNPIEYELFAFQNIIAIRKDIDKEKY